jgi:predicted CXXCH cytochrome family protein
MLFSAFVLLGDTYVADIVFLAPLSSDSTSYDPGKILILSVSKQACDSIVISHQWNEVKLFDLRGEGSRDNFAKDIYTLFEPKTTLQLLTYSFKVFTGYTYPESLTFAYSDSVTIRTLWQKPQFVEFIKKVQQSSDANDILVSIKGWKDSLYTPVYDDPNSDSRALYKVHVRLIPGINDVFCAPAGRRGNAARYSTTLVMDSKPISDRSDHFHNSVLEQSCTTCHEGLPSADSGSSMKSDCNVCHKAMSAGALYLHAPAEMKECATCHSWSAENKTVSVEKGVPTVCYDCHDDKQAQVDSSQYPHPVAGECLTCHSPHGSDQNHIVKEDVYTLCTGCHEDQKSNHPVGRHPLRFAMTKTGEDISCVSCHNPHGANNEHLLKIGGGPMEVCTQCH